MRQRKSNISMPTNGVSPSERNDSDGESTNSRSDHEDSIIASHPDEESGPHSLIETASSEIVQARQIRLFLQGLRTNQTKWAQCLTIAIAALATYSYHNVGASTNVQVAIMTVITLVGASPFSKTHLTTAAIGTFVGGHNIIGATHGLGAAPEVGDRMPSSYLWLMILSASVGSVWCWFVTNPHIKLLDGYAGRLGSTTFIGMNLVMVVLWGPLGVVSWNRYYYGFVDIVHVAEEDSAAPSLASAWSWTEEAELSVGYVVAVLWLGILSGVTRIKHHQYVQEWHRSNQGGAEQAPSPLNNVLVPVLWTLTSILGTNATGYKHAAGLYNGFAVGAYVGMASLQKISSTAKFATVSLVAALWGLALTPFVVGFAGKSGFTSMMGHVTHEVAEKYLWEKIRYRLQRKQRLQAMEEEERNLHQEGEERRQQEQEEERENQRLRQEQEVREAKEDKHISKQYLEPYHPPHKPSRKKELVFSTKQQRRQQQRLRQQEQKQQREQQYLLPDQGQRHFPEEANTNMAPLRHRAWVATPAEGDGVWEHPQLHEVSASSETSMLNVV